VPRQLTNSSRPCWRALAHTVVAACSSSRPLHAAASRTTCLKPRLPSSGSIRLERDCTICHDTTPSILATDRQTARPCSPNHAVPASRHRGCHAKPDPIAGCPRSPPRVNSQNHRPFIVAASRRHTPLRLKSPWRAAAKPPHLDRDFVPWRFSDACRRSASRSSSCRHPRNLHRSGIRTLNAPFATAGIRRFGIQLRTNLWSAQSDPNGTHQTVQVSLFCVSLCQPLGTCGSKFVQRSSFICRDLGSTQRVTPAAVGSLVHKGFAPPFQRAPPRGAAFSALAFI
jgi:hypothetical protein